MDKFMEILVDNYIYVALGSLLVIVLLATIIIIGNKKRNRKGNGEMANFSEVKTGSINDVANNMSNDNVFGMGPQNVTEMTGVIPPVTPTEPVHDAIPDELFAPIGDVTPAVDTVTDNTSTSMPGFTAPVSEPIMESPTPVVETSPVIEPVMEVPTPIAETPNLEPIVEAPIEPVIPTFDSPVMESPMINPTPSFQAEEIEIMEDVTPVTTSSGVQGFSSVNVEPVSDNQNVNM